MTLSWLVICAGTLFLNPVSADCNFTSQTVTCEASGKNLSNIPSNLSQNVTILSLKNNKITLKDIDKEILQSFIKLIELYLNENMIIVLYNNSFCNLTKLVILDISSNRISTVHKTAFAGLNQLSVLNLSYNMITQLDPYTFTCLKSLTALNLQYNPLKYFHIKSPFKLIKIVLAGNPWTCSCDLLDLQIWLTASNVTKENENNTVCTFPNTKEKCSIKTVAIQPADCKTEQAPLENTVTSASAIKLKSSAFLTARTPNITENNGTHAELPLPGKSWTFLAGVLGFVLSITLLIFMAAKCPTWYRYLISYSHRHLEENDSEMFEQEFSADMSSFPTLLDTNNEDPISLEKIHTCVPGEDGFIENKYTDTYATEES
ncbi:leucine-rich repeat-containing protein 19 [Pezoporus wallicus]|uniref:leucine-rich repeat-containing protein 19 n=1 Tax=Pezoporus wallicus TaxID=35540 RepID=UPI00254B1B49|nr:leucine-rich repeat-containing protein 19 [Pezoporus wallicus]XP_057273027.1 leucine-rich repeat-containing protein 19 [Pezoporus wallicus]